MKNILFLCTGNSCRSQMAEGWGKRLKGDRYQFFSAGTKKHGLNPMAVRAMKDSGIDISTHESNTVDELADVEFDYVFTVCSNAHESCPTFSRGKVIHVSFDDPPELTKGLVDDVQVLSVYMRVRDEIKEFVSNIEKHLEK